MIDFIDGYYTTRDPKTLDGYDRERAQQTAVGAVLDLIMKNELTQRQNMCLRYKYINHKTQSEIADILKLSQPTVSRHISTAKDIVNKNLKYCYVALSKCLDEYDRLNNLC